MEWIDCRKNYITLFVGRKGTGKTHLLITILKDKDGFRGQYEEIFIVSSTFKLQSVWKQLSPEGIAVYETFSDSVLEKFTKSSSRIVVKFGSGVYKFQVLLLLVTLKNEFYIMT